ncbi:MAG: hypothetical protein ACT6SG_20670, partial [Hydrogenophaga sp.]|uniref:hypothetical protein n=1 Tax=Hydrogenophaga sp. TaxID=1904254 RepID=UPI004035BC62
VFPGGRPFSLGSFPIINNYSQTIVVYNGKTGAPRLKGLLFFQEKQRKANKTEKFPILMNYIN